MKVAFISSEVVPYSKTGGLADVAGVLPTALARLGVDVSVYSPFYPSVKKHALETLPDLITVPVGKGAEWGAVRKAGRFHFLAQGIAFELRMAL